MVEATEKMRVGPRAVAKYFAQISIVFVAYFVAGKLGQATSNIRSSNLGPVWPAYGVALASVLLANYRIWVAIAASAFLVAFLSPVPHAAAVGQAAGATLAALTGAFLLRIAKFQPSLARLNDVLSLIVFGALGSAMVSASIGVWFLYATDVQAYSGLGSGWLIYWLGDSTGVLLVTPLVLTAPNLLRIRPLARIAEFVALLLLLTLTCFIIFSDLPLIPIQLHVLAFAVLPFIVWAAMRFGVSGAALSTLIVATISTVETALDSGPFAQNTPFTNGVLLDVFFVVLSVSGMTFAAVIAEKEQAERERERLALEHAEIKALASVGPKLIEAQEQERARIGRELHDDIVQRLALLAVELERVQQRSPDLHSRLGELRKQTSDIAIDLQSLSHELHSSKLEYLGVAFAMKSFCKEFGEQQKVEIDFQSHDLPSPVPPDISLCLFRVLQEALHNSVKHSGARHFEARLWGTSDQINLTVRDSGLGFDIEAAKESRGLGLVSMQERVRLVKGTLSIESQPKRGTTIHACVPLSRESDSMRAAG